MKASDFQPGDMVRVSRLVEVEKIDGNYLITTSGSMFADSESSIMTRWDMELVERPVKGWPPEQGDVWVSDKGEFHVLSRKISRNYSTFRSTVAVSSDGAYEISSFGELRRMKNLKLVYRREE